MSNDQTCHQCGESYADGTGTIDGHCSEACDAASDREAFIWHDMKAHVADAVAEERRSLRAALRLVAEDEKRSERERELLLDLVEAFGGEAAS